MSVSFHSFPTNADCGICLNSMVGEDSVAHSGDGEKHPLHKECLKVWMETKQECPFCQAQVDVSSITTWKERAITKLKLIRNDALVVAALGAKVTAAGLIAGVVIGAAGGIARAAGGGDEAIVLAISTVVAVAAVGAIAAGG